MKEIEELAYGTHLANYQVRAFLIFLKRKRLCFFFFLGHNFIKNIAQRRINGNCLLLFVYQQEGF